MIKPRIGLLELSLAAIAALLSAAVMYGFFEKAFSVEAIASIAVAIGTLALAFFTWQSVSKTNDVIEGEDRRHMAGFYPLVFMTAQGGIPGRSEWGITLTNEGEGVAPSGTFEIEGAYKSNTWKTGNTADGFLDPKPLHVTGDFSLVALNRGGARQTSPFPVEDPPQNYNDKVLKKVVLRYKDIFGNNYVTEYADWHKDTTAFKWTPPENLKPKLQAP